MVLYKNKKISFLMWLIFILSFFSKYYFIFHGVRLFNRCDNKRCILRDKRQRITDEFKENTDY